MKQGFKWVQAIRLFEAGESCAEIARTFGVTRQAIHAGLVKRGYIAPSWIEPFAPGKASSEWMKDFELDGRLYDAVRAKTRNAVRNGTLIVQACEVCGESPRRSNGQRDVHAHHDDYNDPLKVRWLCSKHHRQWHLENQPVLIRKKR